MIVAQSKTLLVPGTVILSLVCLTRNGVQDPNRPRSAYVRIRNRGKSQAHHPRDRRQEEETRNRDEGISQHEPASQPAMPMTRRLSCTNVSSVHSRIIGRETAATQRKERAVRHTMQSPGAAERRLFLNI